MCIRDSSYAVPSGTSSQFLKANGSVDSTTYAPLASPTFTGTVTIPSGSVISGVPYLATANTFTGGVQQITTASAATKGLIVKATAGQSVNLFEAQNSSGTAVSRFDASGLLVIGTGNQIQFGGVGDVGIYLSSASAIGIIVRGAASQAANLQEWRNSASAVLAKVASSGNIVAGNMAIATSSVSTIHISNGTIPSANPTGGGVVYVEAGALKYRGSSGTITTLGAA
jgi:hypothetical protein